ncbi:MAG: hypothetical protein ABMB14_30055, partial [Myxococcota bacterium]
IGVGAVDLVVDAPDSHRDALVERLVREQQAAAAIGGAPQLHPEDRRCVPTGRVVPGAEQLDGVELKLEVDCRIVGPGASPPA